MKPRFPGSNAECKLELKSPFPSSYPSLYRHCILVPPELPSLTEMSKALGPHRATYRISPDGQAFLLRHLTQTQAQRADCTLKPPGSVGSHASPANCPLLTVLGRQVSLFYLPVTQESASRYRCGLMGRNSVTVSSPVAGQRGPFAPVGKATSKH